ncbi:hypothetical protein CLU79DRAFT_460021 [Phycomyces nitens]|nr:hypothetical protein CLU79DRAFT_460021 [Phycomyces nitens]
MYVCMCVCVCVCVCFLASPIHHPENLITLNLFNLSLVLFSELSFWIINIWNLISRLHTHIKASKHITSLYKNVRQAPLLSQ